MTNRFLELVAKQLQTKRKGKQKSKKIKRNSFEIHQPLSPLPPPHLSEKILKYLTNHTKDTVALEITQNLKKSVLPADKKGIFNISAQIEETERPVETMVI